jgi:hypothetical protein
MPVVLCKACYWEWRSLETANAYPFKTWLKRPPLSVLLYWLDAMEAEYKSKLSSDQCIQILEHLFEELQVHPDYRRSHIQSRLGLFDE